MGLGLEILENNFLEGFWSDFLAWAWKCLKIAPCLLERLLGLGLEMLENSFLEGFWSDFWAWAWKCLKIALWKRSGAIVGPRPGNP